MSQYYERQFMKSLDEIRVLISSGDVLPAISLLDEYVSSDDSESKDVAYYLRGNAYRKQSNWQMALNDYQRAIDLNPESQAIQARRALLDILEFYNKDMYNQ